MKAQASLQYSHIFQVPYICNVLTNKQNSAYQTRRMHFPQATPLLVRILATRGNSPKRRSEAASSKLTNATPRSITPSAKMPEVQDILIHRLANGGESPKVSKRASSELGTLQTCLE